MQSNSNEPQPRKVKSVKSRHDTIDQETEQPKRTVPKVQSHFLVSSDKLDRVTRRVIAPYARIERKGLKEEERKSGYLDINKFNVFLEDTVDLDSLLYETARVLKTVSVSSGVFVYAVDNFKKEIVLMSQNTKNPERHQVNIPIDEGKVVAAHVASTKEHLVLDDVQRDARFAEGLKWVDAKTALCMPVTEPGGECYAVIELYRTYAEPYDANTVYTVLSVACWAGAAVHQSKARARLHRATLLSSELRALLQSYFCDQAAIDTMLTDMLAIVKSFMGAMRSSFYILARDQVGPLQADMWEDGWRSENKAMPKKKVQVTINKESTPVGHVVRTGKMLNIQDAYKDPRFLAEVDPATGCVVRACLVAPIVDSKGVIGAVQLTNKTNGAVFNKDDEEVFQVFVSYCSLIVHFYNMQQNKIFHENLNKVYDSLMREHLKPCRHDMDELMETNGIIMAPHNFRSYDYHISEGSLEDMPGLACHMFLETFAEHFDRRKLAEFALTILGCYRNNPYHNAEHAFSFTHTMFMILVNNKGCFDFVETAGLMLAGLCHDLDHPGFNNNFLALTQHPLARMYSNSTLEHHHYFLAKKIIEDKRLLSRLPPRDRELILEEIKYNILCTDLAVYFQIRARLTPLLAEDQFEWTDKVHRGMLKGILMTTSDLSGCCKPFDVAKSTALAVYEEFYSQGDRERALGYTPLSMMDRRRAALQPAEQLQFLSVVVLPCLALLQRALPNTAPLLDNCRNTISSWQEELAVRGHKLWRQERSVPGERCHMAKDASYSICSK